MVHAEPEASSVYFGGLPIGAAPLTQVVASGEHALRVTHAGYAPHVRRVTVTAGDTLVVRVALARLQGVLDVQGLPDGASVFVRGASYEGGSVGSGRVPVAVVDAQGRRARATVEVQPGQVAAVEWVPRAFAPVVVPQALLLPGATQMRGGRTLAGGLHAAAVVGGVAATAASWLSGRRAATDREAAYEAYLGATTPTDAYDRWVEVDRLHRDEVRLTRRTSRALLLTGALHALGVADAFVHHAFPPALRVVDGRMAWVLPVR